MAQDRVHIDWETFGTVSLPNVGVGRYSRHPDTEVLMGAWSLNDVKQKQWIPAEGEPLPRDLKEALEDPHVIKWAWNAPFEINITRNVLKIDTPLTSWRDTMVLALTCSLPGKLEKAGPVVDLDEDKQKELYKEQKSSTTIVKDKKVFPNDPCPCGSGKKYKKCCGAR